MNNNDYGEPITLKILPIIYFNFTAKVLKFQSKTLLIVHYSCILNSMSDFSGKNSVSVHQINNSFLTQRDTFV